MIRILAWILTAALMCVPFAFSEETDPMTALKAVLDIDMILTRSKGVSVNRIYYDYDGNEMFSAYQFAGMDADGRRMIVSEDSEGNVEILSEYGCAGFDTWSMKLYVMGFVLNQYDENILNTKQNFFSDMRLNEKFFSEEIREDKRVITTKTYYQGDFAGGCDALEYVFDAETGALTEIYEYFEDADGVRSLNSRAFVTMDAEYEMSEALSALFETENTRAIFVHLPDGETTQFTAPADVEMMLIYPEEYVLYENEAKTHMYAGQEADEEGHYPDETHLYLDVFG
ncbi:MAG: hypothetical protein IKJ65_08550 [Clostridia bacterium]|nr:hypothetical protein [Clostridia bacterium]